MLFKTLFFFGNTEKGGYSKAENGSAALHSKGSVPGLPLHRSFCKMQNAKCSSPKMHGPGPPGHGEGTTCMCQGTGADCTQSIDLK